MCVSTWEVFLQLIAFNLGSLGFLTNHFYENYIRDLKGVIYGREDLEQCCLDLEDGLAVRFIKGDSQIGEHIFHVPLRSKDLCQKEEKNVLLFLHPALQKQSGCESPISGA